MQKRLFQRYKNRRNLDSKEKIRLQDLKTIQKQRETKTIIPRIEEALYYRTLQRNTTL
jgi:hypothetical protein